MLGTDSITAESIAMKVCQDKMILLFPTISIGMSQHHTAFPGSVSLMPSTYAKVIEDIIESLHRSSNFTHFYFINGHGGNIMPFKLAQETLLLKSKVNNRASLQQKALPSIKLFSWFSHPSMVHLAKSLYSEEIGQHATPDEIAITQYLYNAPSSSDRPQLNLTRHATFTRRSKEHIEKSAWQDNLLPDEAENLNRLRNAALSYMDPEQFMIRFPDGRYSILSWCICLKFP